MFYLFAKRTPYNNLQGILPEVQVPGPWICVGATDGCRDVGAIGGGLTRTGRTGLVDSDWD